MESLARWLSQLDDLVERNEAVEFMKSRLLFVGNEEMAHMAHIAFPDFARPLIARRVAEDLKCPAWSRLCLSGEAYETLLRSCLFLGLSDGAHMDLFRRANRELSNEQIFVYYDLPEKKAEDMLGRLLAERGQKRFRMLFLLDDFSGSGLSYMRTESDGTYGGKIQKVLDWLFTDSEPLNRICDLDSLEVHIILYVATTRALSHLRRALKAWCERNRPSLHLSIRCLQEIPDGIRVKEDDKICDILTKYFDGDIVDEHYRKGNCDRPYLGFDGCALPVVFSHNTPNNSIPFLWFDGPKYWGLFPRVGRHRSST